jgi:hypothetical protein
LASQRHSLQDYRIKGIHYRVNGTHTESHCSIGSDRQCHIAAAAAVRNWREWYLGGKTGHEAFWRDLGDPCCRTATQRPLLPDCSSETPAARVQSASDPCCRIAECRVQVTPAARLQFRDPCCQSAECKVQVTPAAGLQSAGIESQAKSLPGQVAGLHTITSDAPRLRVLGLGS